MVKIDLTIRFRKVEIKIFIVKFIIVSCDLVWKFYGDQKLMTIIKFGGTYKKLEWI